MQAARLATAERLVAEGHPRAQFIAEFKLEHPNCDVRTVDRYKALAFNAMRTLREAERAHDVEVRIARWIYLSRKFENERQYGPLVAIEKLLAQGMGVLEAEKHLHLHAQGVQEAPQAGVIILPAELPLLLAHEPLAASEALPAHEAPEGLPGAR